MEHASGRVPGPILREPGHTVGPMKKVALVFVLAVFAPSLVLAWLAVRSLRDQQLMLERQQSLLYKALVEAGTEATNYLYSENHHETTSRAQALLASSQHRDNSASSDQG